MKNIIFAIAMSSASALLGEAWYSNVYKSFGNANEGEKRTGKLVGSTLAGFDCAVAFVSLPALSAYSF